MKNDPPAVEQHDIVHANDTERIKELMKQANTVQSSVADIGVAIHDSRILRFMVPHFLPSIRPSQSLAGSTTDTCRASTLGRIGNEWSRNQSSRRQQFTSLDFMDKLRQKYERGSLDDDDGDAASAINLNWSPLNTDASLHFAWTPAAAFLCAPLAAGMPAPARRPRAAAQRREPAAVLRPHEGDAAGAAQAGKSELVKRMLQCEALLERTGEASYPPRRVCLCLCVCVCVCM